MKKAILLLCFLASATACHARIDVKKIRNRALCVLEELNDRTVYLTALVRLMQGASDEPVHYAGGDEIFLQYEMWTVFNDNKKLTIRESFILHATPERVAMPEGGSYDDWAFETLTEYRDFYVRRKLHGRGTPARIEWDVPGPAHPREPPEKIMEYFLLNSAQIPVRHEDMEKYGR